ncbi:Cytoplasmic tRNA 2-thiolation protein 2 [Operophtera brumata]|uniref:Cytoplasmic tRNA 2-thiolation protein 2 n=1 Tax=Operophtera brumata TaxID=104452 RepID=A0A0L7KMA1_OPEBR|nr:Cytoplasmic tRNA 2-thiolation protein 2 [Operophtera brumata]
MNCNKCNSASSIILRKKDHYCNDCFLICTNHKFRACIGKNKIMSKNDKVLISASGGPGSTALLDLVHYGLSLDIHKKLRIVPFVLHILPDVNTLLTEDHETNKNFQSILNSMPATASNDYLKKVKRSLFIQYAEILRPMKDISQEELNYYIQIKGLNPSYHNDERNNSLQTAISSFVTELQDSFQSTISTVCKTADKIGNITT